MTLKEVVFCGLPVCYHDTSTIKRQRPLLLSAVLQILETQRSVESNEVADMAQV